MTVEQPSEITWGALVLHSEVEPDTPWRFETLVGTHFGNPEPLVEVLRSHLTDGELVRRTGWGNRDEVPLFIRITAPDGQALAQGEAALADQFMSEDGFAPLKWTSPTIGAWPMALDVVHVTPMREWEVNEDDNWDFREVNDYYRDYRLDFTTLPFTRDIEATVIPALPVPDDPDEPAVVISVDTCDTLPAGRWARYAWPTARWSSMSGPTVSAGGIRVQGQLAYAAPGSDTPYLTADRTGAVSMAGTEYLVVDAETNSDTDIPPNLQVRFDGAVRVNAIASQQLTSVRWRYYFARTEDFSFLRIRANFRGSRPTAAYLHVFDISRTDRIEIPDSSGLQVSRTATIEGTAPTGAAINITSGEEPLIASTALVYTGASPVVPLRGLCSNTGSLGALVPDGTKMSGATNDLSVPMVFRIPIAQLANSTYTLLARLSFTGAKIVSWSARLTEPGGSVIPGSDVVVSGSMLLRNDTADPWRIHPIASMALPIIATEVDPGDVVELTVSATSGATITIDEGWLADTDQGAITLVHEPGGFQLTGIELRSAQLDSPRPSVYGTWDGGRVQDITRLVRLGTHRLKPGLVHIFTATDLAKYAAVTLRYYRRYFLHPGPPLPTAVAEE